MKNEDGDGDSKKRVSAQASLDNNEMVDAAVDSPSKKRKPGTGAASSSSCSGNANAGASSQAEPPSSSRPTKVTRKGGSRPSYGGGRVRLPEKLLKHLNGDPMPEVFWWMPDGNGFAYNVQTVQTEFLDKHFSGTKLASFVRSLNRWGFRRVFYHALPAEVIAFYHPKFRRSNPERVKEITMTATSSSRGPEEERGAEAVTEAPSPSVSMNPPAAVGQVQQQQRATLFPPEATVGQPTHGAQVPGLLQQAMALELFQQNLSSLAMLQQNQQNQQQLSQQVQLNLNAMQLQQAPQHQASHLQMQLLAAASMQPQLLQQQPQQPQNMIQAPALLGGQQAFSVLPNNLLQAAFIQQLSQQGLAQGLLGVQQPSTTQTVQEHKQEEEPSESPLEKEPS